MRKQYKKDTSPRVPQRDKISDQLELNIKELEWTEKQKKLIQLINEKETKIVFVKGPAGSSKSICAVYCGLQALKARKTSHIIYSRPILESADAGSRLGFLPGQLSEKTEPYMRVVNEKLDELLDKTTTERLKKDERVEFTEVNYIRGASLNAVYMILDEAQNWTLNELITLITRIGKYSKVVICADISQSDLPFSKQGGFDKLWNVFNDEESEKNGIYRFEFREEDILRSGLCKFIVEKTKDIKKLNNQAQIPSDWAPSSEK